MEEERRRGREAGKKRRGVLLSRAAPERGTAYTSADAKLTIGHNNIGKTVILLLK